MSSRHIPSQRELFRAVRRHGWTVERTSGHYRCLSPDRTQMVVVSGSTSDWRSIRRVLERFRQRGVHL